MDSLSLSIFFFQERKRKRKEQWIGATLIPLGKGGGWGEMFSLKGDRLSIMNASSVRERETNLSVWRDGSTCLVLGPSLFLWIRRQLYPYLHEESAVCQNAHLHSGCNVACENPFFLKEVKKVKDFFSFST